MKVALIDDEDSVRQTIQTILLHYYPDLEILNVSGVAEGLKLVTSFAPDLIFLDIELGDGTGFDFLTRIEKIDCPVVFVTAHDHYAVKAFKFSALDYILKPVDPKEIVASMEKVRDRRIEQDQVKLNTLLQNKNQEQFDKIVLSDNANVHLIDINSIVLCKAVGNYTHFFLQDEREIVISKTLKHYDELLSENDFVRIHQSYLINLHHLDRVNKRDGGEVVMKNGVVIPVSSRKKEILGEVLKKFKA
ncbi:MAG: LytTR family DNA-binding domain-containing protein [Cyclobacteriaceae bacterium]